jgi:hypothetical protein
MAGAALTVLAPTINWPRTPASWPKKESVTSLVIEERMI